MSVQRDGHYHLLEYVAALKNVHLDEFELQIFPRASSRCALLLLHVISVSVLPCAADEIFRGTVDLRYFRRDR